MQGSSDMSHLHRMSMRPPVAAALIALVICGWPPASAQQAATAPADGRTHADDSPWPSGADRHRGGRFGRLPGAPLLRSLPSDQGPLQPGEQQELIDFVRQHVPGIHRALEQLGQKDPDNFTQRLEQAAPLLRRLRRIFDRDPQLGQSIIRHSESLQRLHRARRAWLDGELDPAARSSIEDMMRRTVADNVQIEVAVLEDQVRELDWQRDARIEAEFQRLTAPGADLTGESPELRELVRLLHETQAKAEITWLEDELWLQCATRMDREVKILQERVERMRTNTAEEVDRRMRHLTSPRKPVDRCDGDRAAESPD
jgi:hypothetical protein